MVKIIRGTAGSAHLTAERAEIRTNDIRKDVGRIVNEMPSAQHVIFSPLDEGEVWAAPSRAHAYDAGVDIRISKGVNLQPGASAFVPTGTTVQIPRGYFGLLAVRSGIGRKGVALLNGVGIIDHGYEGEIGLILANFGTEEFMASPGDRIAQLIVAPCVSGSLSTSFRATPRASQSERGDGGFGSTGES